MACALFLELVLFGSLIISVRFCGLVGLGVSFLFLVRYQGEGRALMHFGVFLLVFYFFPLILYVMLPWRHICFIISTCDISLGPWTAFIIFSLAVILPPRLGFRMLIEGGIRT